MEKEPPMNYDFERNEVMHVQVDVVKLTDGLEFGEGSISVEDRTDTDHEHSIDTQTLSNVESAIHSDQIVVKLDDDNGSTVDDDGCGDGRGWQKIYQRIGDKVEYYKRSLNRYKVFGGGATMSTAVVIGSGESKGQDLKSAFSRGINSLKRVGIPFGAHSDDHAHGNNCGCGAIDKAPTIINNTAVYRDNIMTAIGLLTSNTDGLSEVLDNYAGYAKEIEGQHYAGSEVFEEIVDNGKIMKQLEGPHLEVAIVINTVEGYTVNQNYIREASKDKAQVFGVDVPRLTELAEELYKDNPEKQRQAFLSMLVYTLGTAATLTKGDLPVYVVSAKPVDAVSV